MKVLLVSVILVAIGVPSWCQEKTTSVASYRADGAMKLASTTQVSRASFMMRSAADTSQPKKDMTTQSSSQKNPDLACKDGGYPAITMIFSRDPCYLTCSPTWYQAIVAAAPIQYFAPNGSSCHKYIWTFRKFEGSCQNGTCVSQV